MVCSIMSIYCRYLQAIRAEVACGFYYERMEAFVFVFAAFFSRKSNKFSGKMQLNCIPTRISTLQWHIISAYSKHESHARNEKRAKTLGHTDGQTDESPDLLNIYFPASLWYFTFYLKDLFDIMRKLISKVCQQNKTDFSFVLLLYENILCAGIHFHNATGVLQSPQMEFYVLKFVKCRLYRTQFNRNIWLAALKLFYVPCNAC